MPGDKPYNVVVIGAGTAGLVTAAGTAGLGGRVALIERHKMGGDCLNYGCVPSKALIRSSRVAALLRRADRFGFDPAALQVDYARVAGRMRALRARIAPNDSVERFTGLGVEVVLGAARFESSGSVRVGDRVLRARHFVIAAGGRAAVPSIPGLQEAGFQTNETIFELDRLPRRLAVLGGGPIGCELAQALGRLGAEITLIDRGAHLLHREDAEVVIPLERTLEAEGIRLQHQTSVREVLRGPDRVKRLRLETPGGDQELGVDEILVAAGRQPNVEDLDLERAGVAYDRRGIRINEYLQTSQPHIFALGDVAGPYQFTHFADYQARLIVRNILMSGLPSQFKAKADYTVVPWCTFTDPEVARVGLNEQAAERQGIAYDRFVFPFAELDRAILDSADQGFVKVLTARGTDRILGATIVGEAAGELIHELTLAMWKKVGLATLSGMIHVYPTVSQALQRVADAYNRTRLTGRARKLFSWLYRRQLKGLTG
jgi:pyruvate/2-oxoglutarate dehydrogenase complex dihydrolipoamide dehydrogenase (E3) component